MAHHPFQRCGLAALDDLESPAWRELHDQLVSLESDFLALNPHRSEYPWPRHALQCWSRAWEYPYVYYHLREWTRPAVPGLEGRQPGAPENLSILDVGSGVTFFPFAAARLGYHVTCLDLNETYGEDLLAAACRFPPAPGAIAFTAGNAAARLPFSDAAFDGAYCVSVLEHIDQPERAIDSLARVLRPGGFLLLTIDIDMRGNYEIGPEKHARLRDSIEECFEYKYAATSVHPRRLLTTFNSPYARPISTLRRAAYGAWNEVAARKRGMLLACEGYVLTRRS